MVMYQAITWTNDDPDDYDIYITRLQWVATDYTKASY